MESQFPPEMLERLSRSGIVAVLTVDRVEDAPPLARALLEGGVDTMELTLRTPAAVDALRAVRSEVPEMTAGVGTVLAPEQVRLVADAGAAFAVAPGLNPRVVEEAQRIGLPFAPGVVTPSDLERALELGCREVKFFPAEPSGGVRYLASMGAPYSHLGVRFLPLGGLNPENLESYLSHDAVLALGGSWLAPRPTIRAQDWDRIRRNASEARAKIDAVRGNQGDKP